MGVFLGFLGLLLSCGGLPVAAFWAPNPLSWQRTFVFVRRRASCAAAAGAALAIDDEHHVAGSSQQHVVLSDWLQQEIIVEESPSSSGKLIPRASAPHRFVRVIQEMWSSLTATGRLNYLSEGAQSRVRLALVTLAAHAALSERSSAPITSPTGQLFAEMDVNGDGSVDFDEFVKWYDAPIKVSPTRPMLAPALDEAAALSPTEQDTESNAVAADAATRIPPARTGTAAAASAVAAAAAAASVQAASAAPESGLLAGGASWPNLLADAHLVGSVLFKGAGAGQMAPDEAERRREAWLASGSRSFDGGGSGAGGGYGGYGGAINGGSANPRAYDHNPPAAGYAGDVYGSGRDIVAYRAAAAAAAQTPERRAVAGPRRSVAADLERAMQVADVLVGASADADTLVAALASEAMRLPGIGNTGSGYGDHSSYADASTGYHSESGYREDGDNHYYSGGGDSGDGGGGYDLDAIGEQFGPVVRAIAEDRGLLQRLARPAAAAESLRALQASPSGLRAVRDLDDRDAKLLREYLLHAAQDVRALVVHMADLVLRLRAVTDAAPTAAGTPGAAAGYGADAVGFTRSYGGYGALPAAERHHIALEALQLYVPVSNALGLGAGFRELEELGYLALFPETYGRVAAWHGELWAGGHTVLAAARQRLLAALRAAPALAGAPVEVHVRTKCVVSTFRKVFRQNKRVEDVHDLFGVRIIVFPPPEPAAPRRLLLLPGAGAEAIAAASSGSAAPAAESTVDGATVSPATTAVSVPTGWSGLRGSNRSASGGDGIDGMAAVRENAPPVRDDATVSAAEAAVAPVSQPMAVFTHRTYPPPYRDADSVTCHAVYDVVRALFEEEPGRYKNYIDFPKSNGYRSIHTCVRHAPSGVGFEVQVRTAAMHADAETGLASHSFYKGGLASPDDAARFRNKAGSVLAADGGSRLAPASAEPAAAAVPMAAAAAAAGVAVVPSVEAAAAATAVATAVPLVKTADVSSGGMSLLSMNVLSAEHVAVVAVDATACSAGDQLAGSSDPAGRAAAALARERRRGGKQRPRRGPTLQQSVDPRQLQPKRWRS